MSEKKPAQSRTVIKGRSVKVHLTIDDDAVDAYEIRLNGQLIRGVYRSSAAPVVERDTNA